MIVGVENDHASHLDFEKGVVYVIRLYRQFAYVGTFSKCLQDRISQIGRRDALVRRFDVARTSLAYIRLRSILHLMKLSYFNSICYMVHVQSWPFSCRVNETKYHWNVALMKQSIKVSYHWKISVEREMRSAVSNTTSRFVSEQAR